MVQPCVWVKEESSQFFIGQIAQSITCSIMEKLHTGLDECHRTLLSCFKARNSATQSHFLLFVVAERCAKNCAQLSSSSSSSAFRISSFVGVLRQREKYKTVTMKETSARCEQSPPNPYILTCTGCPIWFETWVGLNLT